MDKDYLKGIKIGLGFFTVCFILFGLVYAVGFHTANEILGGTFQGDYIFNGSLNLSNSNVTGIGENYKLGDYLSRTWNTIYYAETDGFILFRAQNSQTGSHCYAYVNSDPNSTPSTIIAQTGHRDDQATGSFYDTLVPIKKGNYWHVYDNGFCYGQVVKWISLS